MNNTFTRIASIFKKALARRGMDVRFFGVLGQPPFTEDTVLTSTPGIVYVTDSVTGIVRQVLNRRVQNKVFEHVAVGYDPSQPDVLQVLYARDVFGDQDKSPAVPDHADTHAEDGGDTDFVSGGRIKPFLVLPYSGFTVQVFGGLFIKGDHSQGVLANQLVDLSAYQPAAGAKWILLEYADDGTISVVEGDTVDTVGILNVSDVPVATYKPLQDIKLYDGQEKIRRDVEINDFADPRFGWAGHTDESEYDFIQFDIDAVYAEVAGRMGWNADEYTVNVVTGLGPVLQVGQEIYLLVYNNLVSQIDNLTVLRPLTATVIGGEVVIVPELAQADTWEHCEGTLMVATMDIPPSSIGLATRFGRARGGDTSGFSAPGVGLFLSGTVSGGLEETLPEFPHFNISMGGVLVKDALVGEIFVTITRDIFDTTLNFWNGTFRESFDFRVDSDGATVTGSLEPTNGHDDMTMIFSDGFTLLDTNPAKTIALTPGTDTVPQLNYIYIPKSTKVLTVSTSGWPTAEHVRVATVILKTAATVQATGASKDHNWNDHIASTDTFQGHLSHIGAAIREKLDATWKAGTEATLTLDAAPAPDDLFISVTGGKVKQLHDQTFPLFDMTQYSIDAVSTGSKTFTISGDGDLSSIFPAGRIIQVNNSTLNDRLYTIASILWSDPDFIITVEETIPDATADGTIGDDIDVVNDSVAAFKSILNLNEITLDADGSTINNKWFSVVLWGVANKSGEPSQLMLNLPTGSYNTEVLAVTDANNYSIYDIPADYKGTGFLVARFTVKKATNVWTYNSGVGYHDLRGKVPNATVGGGGGGGGGATTLLALTDTFASYAGQALKLLRVNAGETATELAEIGADIINALTGKTTPVDADELVLADSAASNVAKKLTWANLKTTLGVSPDGWTAYSAVTPTRASADDPTYVLTFASVDITGIISVGMKIKWTQNSIVRYGIVTAITFSTDTTLTLYGGTDYDVEDTGIYAISDFYYSIARAPLNFPMSPLKWQVRVTDTQTKTKTTPVIGTFYGGANAYTTGTNISVFMPIGEWIVYHKSLVQHQSASASADITATLSTSNNSESHPNLSASVIITLSAGVPQATGQAVVSEQIAAASKTTWYYLLVSKFIGGGTLVNFGAVNQTVITFTCAYL